MLAGKPDMWWIHLFCGSVLGSEPEWMLHGQRAKTMVSFEGSLTGRRFLGCIMQLCEELVIFSSICKFLCCVVLCSAITKCGMLVLDVYTECQHNFYKQLS